MKINTTAMKNDGEANWLITNQKDILINCKNIADYRMRGVNEDVVCTAKGYIPWTSEEGIMVLVPCYYTKHVHG